MNLEFLKDEIIPQRDKEIEEWEPTWWTRNPIYIIYDITTIVTTIDNEYSNLEDCNLFWYEPENWEYKADDEYIEEYEWENNDNGDCTRFYLDRFVAMFFTRKAAEEYLKYQKHNLSGRAYIYVHNVWYSNREMDGLLDNK